MKHVVSTPYTGRRALGSRGNPSRAAERPLLMMLRRRASVRVSAAAPSNEKTSTPPTSSSPSPTSSAPLPPTISTAVVGQIVPFRASSSPTTVEAPPNFPKVLILPGFGNAAEDYTSRSLSSSSPPPRPSPPSDGGKNSPFSSLLSSLFSSSKAEDGDDEEETGGGGAEEEETTSPPNLPPPPSLASALEARGFSVAVVPVRRSDWFRVARCAVDPAYWRGEAEPETAYGWYLDLAERAVEEAAASSPSESVILLAHSAGGWLGRSLLGRAGSPVRSRVVALCTLGTPHAHNEAARCVTGGALARVNERWPGAFFSSTSSSTFSESDDGDGEEKGGEQGRKKVKGGIRYVAVAGRAVVGDVFAPRGTVARAAAAAYSQVAGGDGHGVAGDGVVPLSSAMLPGAENVVLDGVFHAPRRSLREEEEAGSEKGEDEASTAAAAAAGAEASVAAARWFGEEAVVDSWLHALVKALEE